MTPRANDPWPSFRGEGYPPPNHGARSECGPITHQSLQDSWGSLHAFKDETTYLSFSLFYFLHLTKAYELKRVCVLPSLPSKQCCDKNECLRLRVGVSVQYELDTDMCAVFH